MFETTTLAILTSLVVMSTKYDCQVIRSEIVQHLMQHYPNKLEDFEEEEEKPKTLFSEISAVQNFRFLSVALKLHTPVLLPLMFYACAIHPLKVIFASYNVLRQFDRETIILGRECMTKFAYEAGMMALHPVLKCKSLLCFERRSQVIAKHVNFGSFAPPIFPLQMSPEGIFAVDGGNRAEICRPCLHCYVVRLKDVQINFWSCLPTMFNLDDWDDLRRASL